MKYNLEFEIYNSINKIPKKRYLEMNDILTNDYIKRNGIEKYNENKERLTHEGFNNWVNMITNDPNYNIVLSLIDNKIIGFVCFMYYEDNKLMLSEVQIIPEYQKKNILKLLLTKVIDVADKSKYTTIVGTINKNNINSQQVFTHIGMINTKDNLYEISCDNIMKWINKK